MLKDKHWLTKMDKEGLAHDIRYALAPLSSNPSQAVIDADRKFVIVGLRLLADPRENRLNVLGSLVPITAKFSGDKFISNPLSFLNKNPDGSLQKPTDEEVKLYNEVLSKVSQQGYGEPADEEKIKEELREDVEDELVKMYQVSGLYGSPTTGNGKKGGGKKGKSGRKKGDGRKPTKWDIHLADVRKKNPKITFKEAMIKAKDSYKR